MADRCVVHPASSTVSSGLNLSVERVGNVDSFLAGSYQCVVLSAAIVAHKPYIQCEIVRISTRILTSSCSIGHNCCCNFSSCAVAASDLNYRCRLIEGVLARYLDFQRILNLSNTVETILCASLAAGWTTHRSDVANTPSTIPLRLEELYLSVI